MNSGFVERRRYFRLDDQALLSFVPIHASQAELKPLTRDDALDRMEIEIGSLLSQLRSTHPGTARLIELLNQKITHLARPDVIPGEGVPEQQLTDINLSACGIRFLTHDDLHGHTHLRLYLTLLPTNTPLCLISRLVAIETNPQYPQQPDAPRWLIRATFDPIFESDEEQLIQHMLRLQSRQLAARQREQE